MNTDFLKHHEISEVLFRRTPFVYSRMRRLFEHLECADLATRRRKTQAQLSAVLAAAAKTPFYRAKNLSNNFANYPLLNKESVRDAPDAFRVSTWLPVVNAATGGTTGIPLKLRRSWSSVIAEQAALDHMCAKAGVDLRQARIAILRGDTLKDPDDMTPPFWRTRIGGRQLVLSSYHLCGATIEQYITQLQRFSPEVLWIYPTALELLCGFDTQGQNKLPSLKLVLCSSEMLRPDVRTRAKQVFGVPIFDYYGQAERVNLVVSTSENAFYFSPGYGYNELIFSYTDQDYDYYEIIGTGLWNKAQPLIRYRTGDLAIIDKGTDTVELEQICFGLKPFAGIAGRDNEYIETPTGVRVTAINQIPRGLDAVLQMQFIQRSKDHVDLYVVVKNNLDVQLRDKILAQSRVRIPQSINIDLHQVERIRRTNRGKAPLVIKDFLL